MPGRTRLRSISGSRDGIALILVLAFIVLITILIVSFIAFSRLNRMSTASYSQSIQAQEIAQGGMEDIMNDLHQEIVAGSTAQNGGSSTFATVYVPTTNWTAQPARLGYTASSYGTDVTSATLPPTLIRVSRASQDGVPTDVDPPINTNTAYYPGTFPPNRASAANSSRNSINYHNISAARWNKIALLSTNSVIPPPFATDTPDWVYVTRSGSRVCTAADLTSATTNIKRSSSLTSTTAVVGRYAYAIYDEGALLDVNAAGYISSATNSYASASPTTIYTNSTTGISQVVTGKTYSAYADLTQLPGLSGSQNVVDNLITWRNASAALTPAGTTAGVNFLQASFTNAKAGFKTFSSGDSPLLSRQDLINYFAQIDPSGTSYAAALPYLGTFTRAANAPSWTPTADSPNLPGYVGGSYNGIAPVTYKSNAELTSTTLFNEPPSAPPPVAATFPNPNRDIPNVRYTQSGTVTHYADNGSTTTYTVQVGDPAVQHRFSLAKLSWLTYQGPSATVSGGNPGGTAANIQACFGLIWGMNLEKNTCWIYAGPTGSVARSSIETLDEVAAETPPREPNFFEMLKAGILAGSLGQTPGPLINGEESGGIWVANPGPVEGISGSGFVTYSGARDRQILQIGANLIDQSDTDSYPTDICMALVTATTSEEDLSVNNVYGDENLPTLSRMCPFVVAIPSMSYKLWYQPEIWNPHQAVGVETAVAATVPTNFRVHAYGAVQLTMTDTGTYSSTDALLNYDAASGTTYGYTDLNGSTVVQAAVSDLAVVNFQDPNTGTVSSPFYNNPIRLDKNSPSNSTLVANSLVFPATAAVINDWGELGDITQLPADYTGSGTVGNTSPTPSGTLQPDSSEAFAAIFGGECDNIDLTKSPWKGYNTLYCAVSPTPALAFSLDYEDSTKVWHPYNFMANIKDQEAQVSVFVRLNPDGTESNYNTSSNTPTEGTTIYSTTATYSHVDPRTDRFSCIETTSGGNGRWNMDSTVDSGPTDATLSASYSLGSQGQVQGTQQTFPYRNYGFVYYPNPPASFAWEAYELWLGFWPVNQPGSTTTNAYYLDPDGVVRPGDAYRRDPTTTDANGNYSTKTTGDGSGFWNASHSITAPLAPTNLAAATTTTNLGSAQARRAVILNRPFRSVAEMGYAFRDVPFKTLDFFSKESGDAALLDLFSVADEPATAAGQVNLSNSPASVIKAVLNGASKMEINNPVSDSTGFPNFLTSADATAASSAIVSYLIQNGPLNNRADLVAKLSDPIFTSLYSQSVGSGSAAGCANYANKAYAEAPVRALSDVTSTRTWNLLIDIIAQSGFMAPNAKTLNDFTVAGERRYWLHISIDRYTGKIIDQQLEPVYE